LWNWLALTDRFFFDQRFFINRGRRLRSSSFIRSSSCNQKTHLGEFGRILDAPDGDGTWEFSRVAGESGTVCSTDADFGRFQRLRWRNPLLGG